MFDKTRLVHNKSFLGQNSLAR